MPEGGGQLLSSARGSASRHLLGDMVAAQISTGTSETWMPQGEHNARLMNTALGERVTFRKGQYLFKQGDVDGLFYVLQTGKIHVYTLSDDGHESILNIMGPGSLIGEAAALSSEPRYSTARAIETSQAIRLNVRELPRYVERDPQFIVSLLFIVSIKQRQLVGRLKRVINDNPEVRVLRMLRQVARIQRDARAATQPVRVNLTHEQIGNLTDLSRVTVTRTLQRLRRSGEIQIVGRAILVRELAI